MEQSRSEAERCRHHVVALRLFGEEVFVVIEVDFDAGRIAPVADPMTETALRSYLARVETPLDEVDDRIQQARRLRGTLVGRPVGALAGN